MKIESSASFNQLSRLLPSDAGISALCYLPGNEWFSMSAFDARSSRMSASKDSLNRRRKGQNEVRRHVAPLRSIVTDGDA
eukprot:755149-Hanusia_phi.AAC.1